MNINYWKMIQLLMTASPDEVFIRSKYITKMSGVRYDSKNCQLFIYEENLQATLYHDKNLRPGIFLDFENNLCRSEGPLDELLLHAFDAGIIEYMLIKKSDGTIKKEPMSDSQRFMSFRVNDFDALIKIIFNGAPDSKTAAE